MEERRKKNILLKQGKTPNLKIEKTTKKAKEDAEHPEDQELRSPRPSTEPQMRKL